MLHRIGACALALLLTMPALAQERVRRPGPPLLVVQGAEQPMRLQRATVDVDIGGGMADTSIELAFHNPNRRALEGELQFPLAPGQKIVGFALDVDGEMRAAAAVDKAHGRQVFEAIERRGVDPALLEATQGENFKLRIFPIPANGERRVRLRIAQPLERSGATWRYRLPVAYAAGADDWRAAVRVHGADAAPVLTGAMAEPPPFRREADGYAADLTRGVLARGELANGELAVQGRIDPAPHAWTAVSGDTSYFVAELPVATTPRARRLPAVVGLLWDSSGSGATRRHAREFALLDRYFRAAGDVEVRLIRLRDQPEPARSFAIHGGDWSALRRELEATVYDGASALSGWTPERRVGEYLLFSDGLENYGTRSFPTVGPHQRVYAVNAAASADTARLDALAQRHGGRLVDLGADDGDDAAHALLDEAVRIASLSGDGLDALQAASLDVRAGLLRVAGRRLQADGVLRVTLDDGRTLAVPVTPSSPRQPLAPLLWAGWRIDALQADGATRRAEIARLGKRFGIATRDTSLIVLELPADYARYGIEPPPALRAEVERLQALGVGARTAGSGAKRERIVREFASKQAWWEHRYPQDAPRLDAQPWLEPGATTTVKVMGSAVMPPPPSIPEAGFFARTPAPPAPPAPPVPPAPFMPRSAERRAVPATRAEQPAIGIALAPWTPDQRHTDRMAQATAAQAYAIYLDEQPDHASSTAFYLDVADTLLAKGARDLALRVLSNLAEMDLENRQVLRVLGYRLLQAGAPELAVPVFEEVLRVAEEEPQSWRDLGLAHAAAGRPQQAVDMLYQVAVRDWDARFAEVELIALADMNAIVAASHGKVDTSRIDPRLLRNLPLDLRVVLSWDADNADMDLWVTDPNGERCMYSHPRTYQGGRLSRDATGGYGPEEFSLRSAKPGKYKVEANFFGQRRQVVTGATTLQVKLTTGFGTVRAKEQVVTLRLRGRGDTVFVGEFEVPSKR